MSAIFLMKKHTVGNTTVVAICDQTVFGKKVEEGDTVLAVTSPFYGGEKATLEQILVAIKESTTANIVGNIIVTKLLEKGVLKESGVLTVKNIKHAHIYKV